jgi:hypothetical protein
MGGVEVVRASHRIGQDEGVGDLDIVYVEGIFHAQNLLYTVVIA